MPPCLLRCLRRTLPLEVLLRRPRLSAVVEVVAVVVVAIHQAVHPPSRTPRPAARDSVVDGTVTMGVEMMVMEVVGMTIRRRLIPRRPRGEARIDSGARWLN